jgi:hypothetical protein
MYRIQIENGQDDNQGHLIDGMDNVSTKIKALPKDQIHKASAEVEIGEYIMNPNTLSLHKALGKRHSKGGTPVNIPDNSFIFSDFKDLGFDKSDKERFEFKLGGTKLKNNTPAKVLEKNIDIKHHNKMINILNSNSQDDIAKNSANLMLTKNLEMIGKVAYVQEGKKGFPQGIPPFSQGTAPVYKKEVDDEITQSVQYMKYGGSMIPKYQMGKSTYNDRQRFWQDQGQLQLYPEINWKGTQHANNGVYDQAREDEFRKRNQWFFNQNPNASMRNPQDVLKFQKAYDEMYANEFNGEHYFYGNNDMGFDSRFGNKTFNAPAFVRNSKQIYGNLNDYNKAISIPQNNTVQNIDGRPIVNRINNIGPGLDYNRNQSPQFTPEQIFGHVKTPLPALDYTIPQEPVTNTGLNAGDIGEPYTNQFQPVGFTPWQNFNMALPLINKLGIKSQYPLYQQQRSVAPEQTLMSADPYLNQIGMDYNQAASMNRIMSPTQAYANNSELYGKKLDANNNALNQINQGNAQIQNNQNQLAAQTYNADMINNLKFNKQYYDELATTNQNKERYKDFYNNQFMTNANQMIAENQAFNNLLNTQQTPDGQPLYIPVSNGFGYSMQFNPNAKRDILNGQYSQGSNNIYQSLLSQYDNETDPNKIRALGYRLAALEKAMYAPKAKKGGFIPKFKL